MARDEHVPLVRFVLDKVAGIEALNQEDGIHPNAQGARLVADTRLAGARSRCWHAVTRS